MAASTTGTASRSARYSCTSPPRRGTYSLSMPKGCRSPLRSCTAALSEIAHARGQTLAQLALQWVLRDSVVTSALIGASRPQQVIENVAALSFPELTQQELDQIEEALKLYE